MSTGNAVDFGNLLLQEEEDLQVLAQMVMEVLVSYQAQETAEYLTPSLASVTP